MRLFVALKASSLPDPGPLLKKLRVNLDQKGIDARWVPRENYHVTLNFLGEVAQERIPELSLLLAQVAAEFAPFPLQVHGVHAFPSERSGRVFVLNVQNSRPLRELQQRSADLLQAQGWNPDEREYRPHLTVARLRSPRNVSDMMSPVKKADFGELMVDELILYQSRLGGSFPIYEALKRYPLNQPRS